MEFDEFIIYSTRDVLSIYLYALTVVRNYAVLVVSCTL